MKRLPIIALIAATATGLQAGDWGKAPVDKTPIEECVDLGGEISVGYETDYIFNGVLFAGDSVWTDVNYTFDGLPLPITIGAWYLNGINESAVGAAYDELNLYVKAGLGTFAGFDVDLGYTHYTFPEFRSNIVPLGGYGEAQLGISRSLGFVDVKYSAAYAFGGGGFAPSGWFHELGAEKTFTVTDSIGFVLGAGVAYSDGFWGPSGWNHYYATAALPITLNCRTTLTPYIGYIGAPDTWVVDGFFGSNEPQTDVLHGGVSLNVSF
jgi:hypothetical protein